MLSLPTDFCIPIYGFQKPYKATFPDREVWQTQMEEMLGDRLVCYTDGSRLSEIESSGYGVFCENPQVEFSAPLGKWATVFQAEVLAIATCSDKLLEEGIQNKSIAICSDSQAAIQALTSVTTKSSLVGECWASLDGLARKNEVELIWVPGHTGVPGNEEADQLAKQGSETPFMAPEPAIGISPQQAKTALDQWLIGRQHFAWWTTPGCRQAKILIEGPDPHMWQKLVMLKRSELRLIIGLLTGHCTLQRHLSIMGLVDNPTCPYCDKEAESALHFLARCEHFWAHRYKHLGASEFRNEQALRECKLKDILAFVKSTKRFSEEEGGAVNADPLP
jgi:ribonuclease HI